MHNQTKISSLFYMCALFMCLSYLLVGNSAAQVNLEPVVVPDDSMYTFESISVDGVELLAVTSSSDFGDYAGYTLSADGEKKVGFTIIGGEFVRHDYEGSKNTYFYALSNTGIAAGYYEDSNDQRHGVVLLNGELRRWNFQDSVQTEIFGISDTTGALTGNYIDASGVRRGFSGDSIIEFPGASETYADFVSAGLLVGSYIDAEGTYHAYVLTRERGFTSIGLPNAAELEYYFVHGINDAGTYVALHTKPVGGNQSSG